MGAAKKLINHNRLGRIGADAPEYSIVIPICHGGVLLREMLLSLRVIDYPRPRFEVILSGTQNDMDDARAVAAEAEATGIHMIYCGSEDRRRSALLNIACRAARGRYLAFADDDCIFRKDWLKKLDDTFQWHPEAGIVGGIDELEKPRRIFDIALDRVLNSPIGTGGVCLGRASSTGQYYPKLWNMALPRHVAMEVASFPEADCPEIFDEDFSVHEDVALAEKIRQTGKKIVFAPEVRIGHKRDTSFLSFVIRNFKMAQVSRRMGVHRPAHWALAALVLDVSFFAVAYTFVPPVVRPPLIIFILIYGFVLSIGALEGYWKTRRVLVSAVIPVLMICLHFSRGFGTLWPFQRKPRDRTIIFLLQAVL